MEQALFDISFITVNYNGYADTCALIDSLTKYVKQVSNEIIVADNASQNNEAGALQKQYPTIQVIPSSTNLGFAGGNNLGIRKAQGRYIMLINNDTFIQEDHFETLVQAMDKNPQIGILCPKIRFAGGEQRIQYAGFTPLSCFSLRNQGIGCGELDCGQYDTPRPTALPHGAAMLIRQSALNKIGLMPEHYFLYYEEIDWGTRFMEKGYSIEYNPAVTVFHKESQSTGQNSPLRSFYLTRNRIWFARTHRKGFTRFVSLLYLSLGVGTRDILRHLFQKRFDLVTATLRGINQGIFTCIKKK